MSIGMDLKFVFCFFFMYLLCKYEFVSQLNIYIYISLFFSFYMKGLALAGRILLLFSVLLV